MLMMVTVVTKASAVTRTDLLLLLLLVLVLLEEPCVVTDGDNGVILVIRTVPVLTLLMLELELLLVFTLFPTNIIIFTDFYLLYPTVQCSAVQCSSYTIVLFVYCIVLSP
jgi:hypothetical protein